MEITELLSRLEGVRGREGAYTAKCPAHPDRSPSLSIKALADGRILLHCFAGCEVLAVLDAMGLTFADVMPECLGEFSSRRGFSSLDALRCLASDATFLAIAAEELERGAAPGCVDELCRAAGRIRTALEFVGGK